MNGFDASKRRISGVASTRCLIPKEETRVITNGINRKNNARVRDKGLLTNPPNQMK